MGVTESSLTQSLHDFSYDRVYCGHVAKLPNSQCYVKLFTFLSLAECNACLHVHVRLIIWQVFPRQQAYPFP